MAHTTAAIAVVAIIRIRWRSMSVMTSGLSGRAAFRLIPSGACLFLRRTTALRGCVESEKRCDCPRPEEDVPDLMNTAAWSLLST